MPRLLCAPSLRRKALIAQVWLYFRTGNIVGHMTAQLPQPAFWILTVLAAGRRHGYEIMREASEASEGRVELKVTTLYAALERLEREGLIVADGEEVVNGRARRYYRITDAGSGRLTREIDVLARSVRAASERLAQVRIATLMPTLAEAR